MPQGTPETGLGLPASLSVQFADGAAGEVAVAWQCAAGYDPSAEAGGQFTFAAVLPEGYALAEGVSLPQILVTLTPPLANAMLAAQASGEGWTLSDDGKLTVTGKVESSKIPSFASVESIEVAGYANFTLNINAPFPGSITVMPYGAFINQGNVSGNISVESGGVFANFGTISGGAITGQVSNLNTGSITVGDFTEATVENFDGSVIGGTFSNVAFDSTSGELTITGNVDQDEEDALAPLTIRQAQIKSVVAENGTFNAGSASFLGPVTNNGTITGGTFNGPITNSGEITGGTFEGEVLTSPSCVISGGDFKNATAINGGGIINGGIFSNFTMDSETGKLTIPARST